MYAGATGVATVISDSNKRQLVGKVICRWARDGHSDDWGGSDWVQRRRGTGWADSWSWDARSDHNGPDFQVRDAWPDNTWGDFAWDTTRGATAGLTRRSRIRGRGLLGRTTDGLRAATPSFPLEHARASRLMLGLTMHRAQACFGRRAQIRPLPVCCIPVKDCYLGSSLTTYSLCKSWLCPRV